MQSPSGEQGGKAQPPEQPVLPANSLEVVVGKRVGLFRDGLLGVGKHLVGDDGLPVAFNFNLTVAGYAEEQRRALEPYFNNRPIDAIFRLFERCAELPDDSALVQAERSTWDKLIARATNQLVANDWSYPQDDQAIIDIFTNRLPGLDQLAILASTDDHGDFQSVTLPLLGMIPIFTKEGLRYIAPSPGFLLQILLASGAVTQGTTLKTLKTAQDYSDGMLVTTGPLDTFIPGIKLRVNLVPPQFDSFRSPSLDVFFDMRATALSVVPTLPPEEK
jgi:hypothetical protein